MAKARPSQPSPSALGRAAWPQGAVREAAQGFWWCGDTYRAVYTVEFAGVVYVLHAFEKKSRKGIATPKSDLDLVKRRLTRAKEDYEQWQGTQTSK
jgi:phage-related protein